MCPRVSFTTSSNIHSAGDTSRQGTGNNIGIRWIWYNSDHWGFYVLIHSTMVVETWRLILDKMNDRHLGLSVLASQDLLCQNKIIRVEVKFSTATSLSFCGSGTPSHHHQNQIGVLQPPCDIYNKWKTIN